MSIYSLRLVCWLALALLPRDTLCSLLYAVAGHVAGRVIHWVWR